MTPSRCRQRPTIGISLSFPFPFPSLGSGKSFFASPLHPTCSKLKFGLFCSCRVQFFLYVSDYILGLRVRSAIECSSTGDLVAKHIKYGSTRPWRLADLPQTSTPRPPAHSPPSLSNPRVFRTVCFPFLVTGLPET